MRSRRKIELNVRVTDVVPAPEEPVTAMMGCLADMIGPLGPFTLDEKRALLEQRRAVDAVQPLVVLQMIALDALDLRAAAENQRDALMQLVRYAVENPAASPRGGAARLLDDHR